MIRFSLGTHLQPMAPFLDALATVAGKLLFVGKVVGGPGKGVDAVQVFPPLPGQEPGSDRKILIMFPGDLLAITERGGDLLGRGIQGFGLTESPIIVSSRPIRVNPGITVGPDSDPRCGRMWERLLTWIMHEPPTTTADPAVPPVVLVPRTLDVLSSTPLVLGPAVAR